MNQKALELEALLLAIFAALPLYATQAISFIPVFLFHVALGIFAIRVWKGETPWAGSEKLVSIGAIAYLIFFPIDALAISRSLIRSSAHLLLFISVYQAVDAARRPNEGQRVLVTFLIFITSVATATHFSIMFFVLAFSVLMFRQLMHQSHLASTAQLVREPHESPSTKVAMLYVVPTALIALALFPMLPRIRNPFVPGLVAGIAGNSTGLSESIDFRDQRNISPDPQVIARVWMSRDAVAFFTPLRLRGPVYDRWVDGKWRSVRHFSRVPSRNGVFHIARSVGFNREATVQQRISHHSRYLLYLPSGTFVVAGLPTLFEGPSRGVYSAPTISTTRGLVTYRVGMSRERLPLKEETQAPINYPTTPEVTEFARRVAGNAANAAQAAAKIERYLDTTFTYVADPAAIGRVMSVEEFLLAERRGHCEYFAAGMVVMMTSLGYPARIVGGFYGGKLNPLTGYFVLQMRDAHAWVEVYDGEKWRTYDPTPVSMRPGDASQSILRAYVTAIGESVNYFWDRYVLTFGLGDQVAIAVEIITRLRDSLRFSKRSLGFVAGQMRSLGFWLLSFVGVALAILISTLVRRRRSMFAQLVDRLHAVGIRVEPSTTANELVDRLRQERPHLADTAREVVDVYLLEEFSPHTVSPQVRHAARRALSTIRA